VVGVATGMFVLGRIGTGYVLQITIIAGIVAAITLGYCLVVSRRRR
jgi:hypothetical protein